jgi:hypothetical protein
MTMATGYPKGVLFGSGGGFLALLAADREQEHIARAATEAAW